MSPDYAIVPEHFQDTFVEACIQAYYEMHPQDPQETGNMARIVNDRHCERIKRLLDNTKGTVVLGGKINLKTRFCEATIVKDVSLNDILMSEYVVQCRESPGFVVDLLRQRALCPDTAHHSRERCRRSDQCREQLVSRSHRVAHPVLLIDMGFSGHALVLHVFSSDSAFKNKVFDSTQSGLAIANETLLQIQSTFALSWHQTLSHM